MDTGGNLEWDEYDINSSLHFLMLDSKAERDKQAVGTVRLVRFSETKGFPTGKYNPGLYEKISNYDLTRMAEVSRLCITPRFRRRQAGNLTGLRTDSRRMYPFVMFALLREVYKVSIQHGIRYWLTSMEENLHRYLKSFSVVFDPLDDNYMDYYGKVKTFVMNIEKEERILARNRNDLYDFFKVNHRS